jgi:hypothetical protein
MGKRSQRAYQRKFYDGAEHKQTAKRAWNLSAKTDQRREPLSELSSAKISTSAPEANEIRDLGAGSLFRLSLLL